MSSGGKLDRSALDRLADGWEAAWVGRHGASFADCCTPDVRYEDPLATEPLEGVRALTAQAERLWRAFPDARIEGSAERLAGGVFACLPWRLLGTHKGGLGALPATGRFLALHGIHYVEVSDGRIRRARGFFDLYDAGVQLGLMPERGSLGERALLLVKGFGLRPRG